MLQNQQNPRVKYLGLSFSLNNTTKVEFTMPSYAYQRVGGNAISLQMATLGLSACSVQHDFLNPLLGF